MKLPFVLGAAASLLSAAALVPVPSPVAGPFPQGLEPNRGQTAPEFAFLSRPHSVAVSNTGLLYSPLGWRLHFVGANVNATVRFADPLPGTVNLYRGSDPAQWITGLSLYRNVIVDGLYPGISATYHLDASYRLVLRFTVAPGADENLLRFQTANVPLLQTDGLGGVLARASSARFATSILFPAPVVRQDGKTLSAQHLITAPGQFAVRITGRDAASAVEVEMPLTYAGFVNPQGSLQMAASANDGSVQVTTVPDAAGLPDPFAPARGCGQDLFDSAYFCLDTVVWRTDPNGNLRFLTVLSGRTNEQPATAQTASGTTLFLTGQTNSPDFPVTGNGYQTRYGGPDASRGQTLFTTTAGDLFAVKLDANTGKLLAATFLGGPEADIVSGAEVGPDGSLYFLPKLFTGTPTAGMPVSGGALQRVCTPNRDVACTNGYAARLSPDLDKLIYGTYLPGGAQATAKVHTDGSLYYAGATIGSIPVTPGAAQQRTAAIADGFLARLAPDGGSFLFATYLSGTAPKPDDRSGVFHIAVAPDGSAWASISTNTESTGLTRYRLVHVDALGTKLLADRPWLAIPRAVNSAGDLFADVAERLAPSPGAIMSRPCLSGGSYVRLSPTAEVLFATYLPTYASFVGSVSAAGRPIFAYGGGWVKVVETAEPKLVAGCAVNGASFASQQLAPGLIATVFGGKLGPQQGASFQLEGGRVPLNLAGTEVFVNGEPAPMLYSSAGQVNFIVPYSLKIAEWPTVRVTYQGESSEVKIIEFTQRASIALFRRPAPGEAETQAAALNEDGTINGVRNPARPGSRVVLFGTGGGKTTPESITGEVTPLRLMPLEYGARVQMAVSPMLGQPILPGNDDARQLLVEYAGGAPGLVAGVTQINVKLPDVIPEAPPGSPEAGKPVLPLFTITPGVGQTGGYVTIAVAR